MKWHGYAHSVYMEEHGDEELQKMANKKESQLKILLISALVFMTLGIKMQTFTSRMSEKIALFLLLMILQKQII